MGYRVDSVTVTMDVYVEFEGQRPITFSYAPLPDDPLVLALIKKQEQLALSEALAAGPADPFILG
jgi:hypothetical protein